ncbi:MAG: cysteine desulfurase [Bacteriovoracaceae bacterium]|nr:cysteine desulfurase [Bacteriovoracaceae bacterium]
MIYADYNGSAPISDDVKEYLQHRMLEGPFANPNAIHFLGQKVLIGMDNARSVCAKIMGAKFSQLVFNSGATEGCSTVYHSVLGCSVKNNRNLIVTSGIEHSAIRKTGEWYVENRGYEIVTIPTLSNGIIDLENFKEVVKENHDKIALVSIMAANNETGVIQPYMEISKVCQDNNVTNFCDTTQLIGKMPFDFNKSGIDYAIMSGHKVGALTGTGILLAKDKTTLKPLIIGGGQEKGLRGGTQNYIGNETLAVALTAVDKNFDNIQVLTKKREDFESKIKEKFPSVVIIGEDAPRLATSTYLSLPGVHGQAIQIELESMGIFVTTSSACSDNEPVTSKVLKSMGITDDVGRGVVRISVGLCSEPEVYDKIYEALTKAYEKLTQIKSY